MGQDDPEEEPRLKQQRPYPAYTVSRKAQAALEGGHPWVYADEIRAAPDPRPENGALVEFGQILFKLF